MLECCATDCTLYTYMVYTVQQHQAPTLGLTTGPSPSPSVGTGSPDFSGVADYDKLAHQICDLIVAVPARVWDSTLGPNSIELKRLLAKR